MKIETNKTIKKAVNLIKKNYFISIILIIGSLTLVFALYKNILVKSDFVYARIAINYPESYYLKPDIWLVSSLKKGDFQQSLLGQPEAEILDKTYYPSQNDITQFNIFLDLKLQANYNKNSGEYSFQRSTIAVGSPITLDFPSSHVTGTILYLGKNPIKETYVQKTVYLVLIGGYKKSSPYFYNSIAIGDKYFDGNRNVFEIIDKKLEKNVFAVTNNLTGLVSEGETDTTQDIIVTTKMNLLEKNNLLVFGQNQVVSIGNKLNLSTNGGLSLNDFAISKIE